MQYTQYVSLCLVALVLGQAAALPQHPQYTLQYPQQYQQVREERKFAEKPNTMKKVAVDDLDDVSTNQIQEGSGGGFSWSNMLGMLMQMLLGQTGGVTGPSKNDIDDGAQASPWTNLLSVGLRVLTALLGGPQQPVDGIDKVDNQSSPMQDILTAVLGAFLGQGRDPDQVAVMAKNASEFISIVINLLDALKTSFSHRSLAARSLGRRDTVSEAAIASISMLKGYVRSVKSFSNVGRAEDEGQRGCAERALCEASAECAADAQGTSSIFCQLGSYATSYMLQRQSGVGFEALYEAGRRGRTGEDCRTLFMDCNAYSIRVGSCIRVKKMTFKSLMNFGGYSKPSHTPIDRYHSGGYHHGSHGSYKSKGGGSGAALSALTLLAFLFLINVMQQSLQDTNSTAVPATTAVLLREELPVVLDTREDKEPKRREDSVHSGSSYGSPPKSTKSYVRVHN
ncbi:hypothetical protein KM043_009324 [Ampulex compressa]|nr:hypothetical protein KM043_009324 [Ampulex compressa]